MPLPSEPPLFTVSQLTQAIKDQLESRFRFVRVCGEISNLKTPFSGHSYFTLKDGTSQIRAVMFKQQQRYLAVPLEDGRELICFGRVSVYEPRGEYQLIVDTVELGGSGRLQQEFERLKEKLSARGYFAGELKKPIPPFPERIIVITSPTGAAVQDFLKIVRLRRAPVTVQILPVRVQGRGAAEEIAAAIARANRLPEAEVIVLCRGGGSLEDLWAFNEEVVAEAIFHSQLPVVTGIGHEIDFTIADFCADLRCPTPTAAAEELLVDATLLHHQVKGLQRRLGQSMGRHLGQWQLRLRHGLQLLGDLGGMLLDREHRLRLSRAYLLQAINTILTARQSSLQATFSRLQPLSPANRIHVQEKQLELFSNRLRHLMAQQMSERQAALSRQAALLDGVSPLATLARGYAVARRRDPQSGTLQVLHRATETRPGEAVEVLLHRGRLDCLVQGCHPADEHDRMDRQE